MSLPLVSCLMPTYNRAWKDPAMIGEAVYWFLAQTYEGPRELVILVDTPKDAPLEVLTPEVVPAGGPAEVRVVHVPERFPHLAAKFDALVRLAKGGILCPWEDDDISLPGRVGRAVPVLQTGYGYYNPKGAFFQNGRGVKLDLCSPHSVHHNAGAFTRQAWAATGGYSGAAAVRWGNKQDTWMDRTLREKVRVYDEYARPSGMEYVYRWCCSPACPNLSGHGDPDAGWDREEVPTGAALVTATMRRNYHMEAEEFREKFAANPDTRSS